MKVKIIVEFVYGEKMTKDIEQFAKEQNMPIEDIARISMENLLEDCYMCADGETSTVRAELIEE